MGGVFSTCCPADEDARSDGHDVGPPRDAAARRQTGARRADAPPGTPLAFEDALDMHPRRPSRASADGAQVPFDASQPDWTPPPRRASGSVPKRSSLSAWFVDGLLSPRTGNAPSGGAGSSAASQGRERGAASGAEAERAPRRTVKILMCGAGESGKSTVVKQMKIIHRGGFTADEVADFRPQIYRDIHTSLVAMLEHVAYDELSRDERTLAAVWQVRRLKPAAWEDLECLPQPYVDAATFLWVELLRASFEDIVRAGRARDATAYFLDDIARIGREGYAPTNDDILRARITTVGINEYVFRADTLAVRMIDVGGQRPEREKWIEAFDGVSAVIFCVALSDYDQALAEDASQNRLVEALQLWDAVVNSKWFADSAIMLFLNKTDIFRRKLAARNDFAAYHADYRPLSVVLGGARGVPVSGHAATPDEEYDHVREWIKGRFLRLNRGKAMVYPFFTCATDTRNIASVFAMVKETILATNMRSAGIM